MQEETTVAGVQFNVQISEVERNIAHMTTALQDPRLASARLVVFPECCVTGYCFESKAEAWDIAESIPGPTTDRLQTAARQHGKVLAYGTLEKQGDDLFNACVLIGPDGVIGVYRKTHLPFLGVDRFTAAGKTPPPVFDLGFMRVGVHICYDASFPEASRMLMLGGADLVILPTSWPPDAARFAEHLAPVRAFENFVYFMIVNRVGHERGFDFIGQSKLCSPRGETIATADSEAEDIIVGAVDTRLARGKRSVREEGKHEIDRLADRRPDLYQLLANQEHTDASGEELI